MRSSFYILILSAILLVGCSNRPRPVAGVANDIRGAVPAGWSVSLSNTTIYIRSERDVVLIGRISRPPGTLDEVARAVGYTNKYEIALSFVPRLTNAKIEQLRAVRLPFERILDTGAASKVEYSQAQNGYAQHLVPVFYTKDYSIFVERPIDRFVEVFPPEAAARVEHLIASLKGIFYEY